MSLPNYQVEVISPLTGDIIHIFDSQALFDLHYDRALDGIGALAMTLPATNAYAAMFPTDTFIEVRRTSPITGMLILEDTYLSRLTHRFREGNDERLVIGAVSLNHLIGRRVIDPAGLGSSAGGFSTKAGTADEVMREFAREQMADLATTGRDFPNFTVGLTPGTGKPVGKRARYENLLDVFQDLAIQGQTDFLISRISANNLRLAIQPIGLDRTKGTNYPFAEFTQFDPDRGNLSAPSLMVDAKKELNFCYALGQGQGDTRIVASVAGDNVSASPYNRIEFTADVRQSDRSDSLYLLTGARKAITDNQVVQEFTFEPITGVSGTIYRKDFDLGDKITARWGDISVDLRVTNVEINIGADGEDLSIKLEPYQV